MLENLALPLMDISLSPGFFSHFLRGQVFFACLFAPRCASRGAVRLYPLRPSVIRLDAAYWGLRLIAWIHTTLGAVAAHEIRNEVM